MPLLDSLERRFRFLAFPGLLRVVAMFQVAVFVMLFFPHPLKPAHHLDHLFDVDSGDDWRQPGG